MALGGPIFYQSNTVVSPRIHCCMPRVFRATSFLALAVCAFAVAACGGDDPFAIRPQLQLATDSFDIRTLTGTPASARALWRIGGFARFRLDSIGEQFDLGFDLDANGRVVVVPARRIAVPPPGTSSLPPIVALQVSTTPYATLDRAPETGFITDTAVVVTVGQTVVVRTQSNVCGNQNTGGSQLFAKFVVDSINTTTRQLKVRSTIQQNCGFRSFATGIPTF
jgi:hypothetical protein